MNPSVKRGSQQVAAGDMAKALGENAGLRF
jgi:hypothetical protein